MPKIRRFHDMGNGKLISKWMYQIVPPSMAK